MIDNLLQYVAPHLCYGCGKSGTILCLSCEHNIKDEAFGRCIWCLMPTSRTDQCTSCARRLGVRAAWGVGARQTTLRRIIDAYKYDSAREASETLSKLLDSSIALLPDDTVVTSVPTITSHIRQRGFDHAVLLARQLARRRALPFSSLLDRQLNIVQHELTREERLKYAKRTYRVKPVAMPRSVLLVDDILTTGATLESCVGLLREAGVQEIYVAIAARQLFSERA